jgi:hypothetical protein
MRIALICLILIGISMAAQAGPRCDLPEEKKKQIVAGLCGGNSKEREYQTFGTNCIRDALRQRARDSAAQVIMLRKCDDPAFAERHRLGSIKALRFIQVLSVCSAEQIDADAIMGEAMAEVGARSGSLRCEGEVLRMITSRKLEFDRMARLADDPTTLTTIFNRLGIEVDAQGNISEKRN